MSSCPCPNASRDAYFDPAGSELRATLLLAGVVGTAAKVVAWMADPRLRAWVVPPGDGRPRLDVAKLVASETGTLYSLSKEGEGSAGALTGALTTTFLTEAERVGQASPTGRLPVPVVAVLDEVANVCRWRDLPDRYSHYGSRGIVCASYLQSWSQGVDCWGREGMRKLWGAANIRVYGGGTHEAEFLEDVSRICGEWDAPSTSVPPTEGAALAVPVAATAAPLGASGCSTWPRSAPCLRREPW